MQAQWNVRRQLLGADNSRCSSSCRVRTLRPVILFSACVFSSLRARIASLWLMVASRTCWLDDFSRSCKVKRTWKADNRVYCKLCRCTKQENSQQAASACSSCTPAGAKTHQCRTLSSASACVRSWSFRLASSRARSRSSVSLSSSRSSREACKVHADTDGTGSAPGRGNAVPASPTPKHGKRHGPVPHL
mgnify:CR=1 FL=1